MSLLKLRLCASISGEYLVVPLADARGLKSGPLI